MKGVKSSGTRGYYRCKHPECTAKKQVQFSRDGQITKTILRGLHNHKPPRASGELTKDGHTGNLNKSEGFVDGSDADESETKESSEMSTVISSEENKLHSGLPVLSTDTNRIVKQEAESLRRRAWRCSRRKDLLLLLMSFPIRLEGDEVGFSLLWDNFIRLNQMMEKLDAISKDDMADFTNLGELMEDRALLKDVENCLAKYDDDINLYFNEYTSHHDSLEKHCKSAVSSVIRQILKCWEWEQLRMIRIYGAHVQEVPRVLEGLLETRSMFQVVIRGTVFPHHTISDIRNDIAEKIHRLVGTDMSLPLDAALKPYKFLLLLHCTCLRTDLHELKIPENGSVVLTTSKRYDLCLTPMFNMMPTDVEKRMLLDVEIWMEDHLLPWTLFWNNVSFTPSEVQRPGTNVSFRPSEIKNVGNQLIQVCHNHLLAIILLARALKSEYDVEVWKRALRELQSLPNPFSAVEGINEVMARVLKFIWERKGILTKHCIKQCISATEDGAVKMHSLVACWLENDLVKSERDGHVVLLDLIESSFLQDVDKDCVQMQRETRDALLSQFVPRLHPLYLMQEGLGLSKAPKVDEWDAKEINLSNNHLSELPEKPNCHSLEKLFLQKNRELMIIPPSFFECMSRLLILDMSYTSIQSFPASITELVRLQKLLLRGCELFTELPSEIGLLQTLEVLDLEGTEIMYLPEELLKAQRLTCFKVSLYGYGEYYRENKQISKRIPKGLFAGFNWLEALSIDINPDDEEWVADVKDIIYELLKLKRLTNLKLYLPEVELLKEIAPVQNFKFIVGHHKQRIVSCLPHEVEEEFEKQENYLKYINGKCIPTEIQNTLNRTGAFFLERHWTVKKLSEFGNENMVKLKFCLLVECNELQTIIDGEESNKYESAVDRKPVLELLEYLGVHCMMSLRSIWEGPVGKGSLSKLKYLALHNCPILSTIFTLSLLGNLCNLEELIVEDCPEIKSLLSQESSCSESSQFLPSLRKMSLLDLPELVSISSGFCIAPKLERIIIYACPMLESLSPAELSSDYLEVIKGEIEWWNSLKWNESEWSSTQRELMASVFVALKRDESLMDQLARS